MTNDGGRVNEPTSYGLRPPNAGQPPYQGQVQGPGQGPGYGQAQGQGPERGAGQQSSVYQPTQAARPPAEPHVPAPAADPRPGAEPGQGRLIGGRYRLVSRLGHGGMGTVWRAHDEVVDRSVAVKEPRVPEHLSESHRDNVYQRMQREARAAARIEHPSVVTMHDVVIEDDKPWIVMELVQGQSLAGRLRDGTLDVREAARIGLAVLGALSAAHEVGVLHRDVKPDNVLLGRGDRVVLTDFGIAQVEGEQGLTETGAFVGSPEFIAPERVLGQHPGPESDLWSLGVVLYAAVEGMSPYRRSNTPATLQAVISAEPQMPARGSGAFGSLVMRLLRKDPAMRPDAAEVRQTLESIVRPAQPALDVTALASHQGGAGAASGGSRWVPPVLHKNRPAQFGLLGGVVAVALALLFVFLDPLGGDELPVGWEARTDREVVEANIAVPSEYERVEGDNGRSVTYWDPSGVFTVYLERIETAEEEDELPPQADAWKKHYEKGGEDGNEIKDQNVVSTASTQQGKEAFDTVVDYVPYSSSNDDPIRYRWQERVVATGEGGDQIYWRLRVSGPAEGWAAQEGDRLFDGVVKHLDIQGL
ncbi:serine/threonine-protein kinase [Streptomyces sp. HNM0663]|uniref:non-specific serine/threonine protein kinase n=1 Tax=Streptomyces chengmaiensis TaxID=3040919 RepID=A0ABT6HL92_9ACTN|nr:serine/threonine-protein kinase [Streptomyces chengmaiensis]MDH2389501.1 serine/threonine-protein kinase [Streptomyces chengmaiensis]